MPDQTIIDESDRGSREYVAYLLLKGMALNENKLDTLGLVRADKTWILKTYARCLQTVRTPGNVDDYLKGLS